MSADPLARWRLVLGRYARRPLGEEGGAPGSPAARREAALDFLYGREYRGRGVREEATAAAPGSLDPAQLEVPRWLAEVRELFPRETVEVMERHALERYRMVELLADPGVLARVEPSEELLRALLALRGLLHGPVLEAARRIVREVVAELTRRLEPDLRRALAGRPDRRRRSALRVSRNVDWARTIRGNLRHWDPGRRRLGLERLFFYARVRRALPWRVVLLVDQSGSMAGSVVHAAVTAGILATLPFVDVRLVAFGTEVVDLSEQAADPVEVLLGVQLGGGTDIARALEYAEGLVAEPQRTAVVLVSDLAEGGSLERLHAACTRLADTGARLLGLAALDARAEPQHDRATAAELAARGMEIAALTPRQLAQWLGRALA